MTLLSCTRSHLVPTPLLRRWSSYTNMMSATSVSNVISKQSPSSKNMFVSLSQPSSSLRRCTRHVRMIRGGLERTSSTPFAAFRMNHHFSQSILSTNKNTTNGGFHNLMRGTLLRNQSMKFSNSSGGNGKNMGYLQWWMSPKEIPPRWTFKWYGEMVLICTVFAITGTSTMVMVRPAVSEVLGLKGSLKDGPWSYRVCSIVIMTPLYACMLVVVGTVFGRHAYFRHFAVKMFSRFGIPPHLMDPTFKQTAKNFRKY